MGYGGNTVRFSMCGYSGDPKLQAVRFYNREMAVTRGQDPNGTFMALQGKTLDNDPNTTNLTWTVGRQGSTEVAQWWINHFQNSDSTFDHAPELLNFAMFGQLSLLVSGGSFGGASEWVVIDNVGLAQGHDNGTNNWWFAVQGAKQESFKTKYTAQNKIGVQWEGYEIGFWRGQNADNESDSGRKSENDPNQVKISFHSPGDKEVRLPSWTP